MSADVSKLGLLAALADVRAQLESHLARARAAEGGPGVTELGVARNSPTDPSPAAPEARGSNLDRLVQVFGLSPFERSILVLCAGIELDAAFAGLCASAQGDPVRTHPTLSLALAALPGAHWSALTPDGPLRYWRLVEMTAGQSLVYAPLRLAEPILHYLVGTPHLDERLLGIAAVRQAGAPLVASHGAVAERLRASWRDGGRASAAVVGGDRSCLEAVIGQAAGGGILQVSASALPSAPAEIETLARIATRETLLHGLQLSVDCFDIGSTDSARLTTIDRFLGLVRAPYAVLSRDRLRLDTQAFVVHDVALPTQDEQTELWRAALDGVGDAAHRAIPSVVSQFRLGPQDIVSAAQKARQVLAGRNTTVATVAAVLWDACRDQARLSLDELAQRIEPAAGWDTLVLPEAQRAVLREVVLHVRHRDQVYRQWGFGGLGARGLGISALFAGASGTGKTMAAEVIAKELRLDLYRIDLSAVVSKYIGETEKNLRRIFDAAEAGSAVLLFDEADALFGKRSEVKDSHDRYANIEVGYLLQRMESYQGLAILTTNLKNSLDSAFMRRIRFVVQFPFPDPAARAQIWQCVFPPATPTRGLAYEKLARLNVAGGNIKNIALNAAFLAAADGGTVAMAHLLRAARSEYAKIEKPLTDAEIAGWLS